MRIRRATLDDQAEITRLQTAQFRKWFGKEPKPTDISSLKEQIVCHVLEDDDGKTVCIIGARPTVEVFTTTPGWAPRDLRRFTDEVQRLWARVVVDLHNLGYRDAAARVGDHLKPYRNYLKNRFMFKKMREDEQVFVFDIEKACNQ
jgi:hypothetical protein